MPLVDNIRANPKRIAIINKRHNSTRSQSQILPACNSKSASVSLLLCTQISANDGVHKNYFHAKYQNLININDCTKLTLEVELTDFFPGIYRGQVIPVAIYVSSGGVRQQNVGDLPNKENNTSMSPTKDEFLSGNYVVVSMSVYWSRGSAGMKQHLIFRQQKLKKQSHPKLKLFLLCICMDSWLI